MIPASLPQHDPDLEARLHDLEAARERYAYDGAAMPPFRLIHALPGDDGLVGSARRTGDGTGLNLVAVKLRTLFDRFDELQDYEDLFALLPRPAIADSWRSDAAFAEQRLSGVEARVIRRIDRLPDNLPLDPDRFLAIAHVPLDQARFEGKLLLADYAVLDGLPAGGERGRSRFLYAPLALFCWVDDPDATRDAPPSQRGHLVPVAIQLDQRPTGDNLYTPHDGLDWLLARTAVQSADHTLGMIAHHLGRVHLGMQPFAIATARQLGRHHPIARLLRPHLRHLLAQDEPTRREFFAEGGYLERLYGPTLAGALELAARSHQQWRLDHWSFPRDLELRGLDGDSVPHYPWRDDGRLVWGALAEFTDHYVQCAYSSDAELAADDELQAWIGELADPSGGDLRGLPPVLTRPALAELLASVVFTLGPDHAALHDRLAECAGFVPNYPAALYGPLPAGRGADESALLAVLPPQDMSLLQLEMVARLTSAPRDQLGHYEADDLLDDPPAVQELVIRLQERLVGAEQQIEQRNRSRAFPYRGMLPGRTPNGAGM